MNDVTWDYEEHATPPTYHIFFFSDTLDEDFYLPIQETPENDADIQAIVEILQRISDRLK